MGQPPPPQPAPGIPPPAYTAAPAYDGAAGLPYGPPQPMPPQPMPPQPMPPQPMPPQPMPPNGYNG